MTEPELSRQQLKLRKQAFLRTASPQYTGMVRTPKPRPRAGLENQAPKDGDWREVTYRRLRTYLTPAQMRRIDHKAGRALAVARRAA